MSDTFRLPVESAKTDHKDYEGHHQRIKPVHIFCTYRFIYVFTNNLDVFKVSNCRKLHKNEKGFQTTLSNYILYLPPGRIFITASTAH